MNRISLFAVAATGLVTSSVFAGGMIRDTGVGASNHAAFGLGLTPTFMSSSGAAAYGAANPFIAGNNFGTTYIPSQQTGSGGEGYFHPDIAANPTTSGAYGSNFLSAQRWYMNGRISLTPNVNRVPLYNSTIGSNLYSDSQSNYVGDLAKVSYGNIGAGAFDNGGWRANMTMSAHLTDGSTPGSANVVITLKLTRTTGGSGPLSSDSSPLNITVAHMGDMEAAGSSTSDVASQDGSSTAAARRINFTDGTSYMQALAVNPTSFNTGTRSTLTGATNLVNTSNMTGAGNISNPNVITTVASPAVGFYWAASLPTVGSTATFQVAYSINQQAFVPEPATLGLLAGLSAMALRRRK
jgi:hypothetical protein